MNKILLKTSLLLIISILILIIFLSTFGIKTNRFNNQISAQIKNINQNIEVSLKEVSIILDPFKFRFNVKTLGTKLKYNDKVIELENVKSKISLKNLIDNKFSLTHLSISSKSLEIKNLISFFRLIKDNSQLFFLEKLIKKGYLIADIDIEFNEIGKIKENYNITGSVKDVKVDFFKKYTLEQLNFIFEIKKDTFKFNKAKIVFSNQNLFLPEFSATKHKNSFLISGFLNNKNFELDKKALKRLTQSNSLYSDIENINFDSENKFSFFIDKKYKIKNLSLSSEIKLNKLEYLNKFDLITFFPKTKEKFNFLNHKIKIDYKNKALKINGSGDIRIQDKIDKINYNIENKDKNIIFSSSLEIIDNPLNLNILNFSKSNDTSLIIKIAGKRNKNKEINFKSISLNEENNDIYIKNLFLSKNYKISNLERVNLNYSDKENLNNKFSIFKKNKNYVLEGTSFNANNLIDKLLKDTTKKKKKLFNRNFRINVDLKKVNLDKENQIKNLKGFLSYKDNDIVESNLEALFSKDKKLLFSIKTSDDEKITTLFSDQAKPLVKRYKFIKGYDEGSLDFYSVKKNNKSISTLKIYDFKLKELPALTKILTLASLQGIADLLSGEGIRFNEFEMNFSNRDQLMTIDEIYAIGPAISILMSGYIEKDKLISLRGTLVPATTLNKTIGSIPFLGEILVGKKAGEGVFGVSFKIKGPPKKLETSVNPIKTLTPRFITRTLEKIKKN